VYVSENNGEPFPYGCVQGDDASVSILLWEMLQQDSSMIEEYKEVDEDTVLEKQLEQLEESINIQLDALYTARVMAKAEIDPVYAQKRKNKINSLMIALKELENDD